MKQIPISGQFGSRSIAAATSIADGTAALAVRPSLSEQARRIAATLSDRSISAKVVAGSVRLAEFVGMTLLAFVGLQRYLEKRIPLRRVRKGECPFCGFPGRGGTHCEGCGRAVVAECRTCSAPRRVGAAHCGACGAA